MAGRANSHRLWPVSFRPHRDEILYSWVARIASLYGLTIEELLPEKRLLNVVSTLVQEADPGTLKSLAASTGYSVDAWPSGPVRVPAGLGPPTSGYDISTVTSRPLCPRHLQFRSAPMPDR